jgi:hypothetical protein
LLVKAEEIVAANGHEFAWLAVVLGNARARRCYERNGWTDTGLIEYPARIAGGSVFTPARRYDKRIAQNAGEAQGC